MRKIPRKNAAPPPLVAEPSSLGVSPPAPSPAANEREPSSAVPLPPPAASSLAVTLSPSPSAAPSAAGAKPGRGTAAIPARVSGGRRVALDAVQALLGVALGVQTIAVSEIVESGLWLNPVVPGVVGLLAVQLARLWLGLKGRLPERGLHATHALDGIFPALLAVLAQRAAVLPPRFVLEPWSLWYVFASMALARARGRREYAVTVGAFAIAAQALLLGYAFLENVVFSLSWQQSQTDAHGYLPGAVFWVLAIVTATVCSSLSDSAASSTKQRSAGAAAGREAAASEREVGASDSPRPSEPIEPTFSLGPRRAEPGSAEPGAAEMRTAAVLCIDIRGFSKISAAMPAARTKKLLAEYHERVRAAVLHCHGKIHETAGDSVVAVFGVDKTSFSAVADGMRCLDELLQMADTWNMERTAQGETLLPVGAACVVANAIVTGEQRGGAFDLSLINDSLNLAHAVEKHNKRANARALTTRQTLEMACAQGYQGFSYVRALPKEAVEGIPHKIDLVVLAEPPSAEKESQAA